MERERAAPAGDVEAGSGRSPSELPPLIDEARAAEGHARREAAEKLNDLLIALRAPGNEAAEAKAILAALDVSTLDGLVDIHGRDCRREAVETLLACGFPHALNVDPEDLAHARSPPAPRSPTPVFDPDMPLVKIGGGLSMFTAVWQLGTAVNLFGYAPLVSVILLASAALTGVGAYQLLQLKPRGSALPAWAFLAAGILGQASLMVVGYGAFPLTQAFLGVISIALSGIGVSQLPPPPDGE